MGKVIWQLMHEEGAEASPDPVLEWLRGHGIDPWLVSSLYPLQIIGSAGEQPSIVYREVVYDGDDVRIIDLDEPDADGQTSCVATVERVCPLRVPPPLS